MIIKPYEPKYWDAICHIHDRARKVELRLANLDDAFLPLEAVVESEGLFEYPHLEVALDGDTVVGFCAYTHEEFAWLYVEPERFRTGIGREIVAHALNTEPGLCCVEALEGNLPAKGLYEQFGFVTERILSGVMPGNEAFPVRVYDMQRKR